MSLRRWMSRKSSAMILPMLALVFLTGCDEEGGDDQEDVCKSVVYLNSLAGGAAGQVTVNGSIAANESVLLRIYVTGQTPTTHTGLPSGGGIVFGNIPAGTFEVEILVSCDKGQESRGGHSVTVG